MKDFLTKLKWRLRGVKVWHYCNIYKTARIGGGTVVGSYTEIGPNVVIGKNCRIGAHCFIPEGVTIKDNCFIGPGTIFSNDMYPPSTRALWVKTNVGPGAALGAGVTVLPGAHIADKAMVGAGLTVVRALEEADLVYTGRNNVRAKEKRKCLQKY